MEKLCDDIVHKLWMVDHHKNLPDVDMRETFEKVHLSWLRENLNEFGVDSAHIKIEKLREFAIDALLFDSYIYASCPCKIIELIIWVCPLYPHSKTVQRILKRGNLPKKP